MIYARVSYLFGFVGSLCFVCVLSLNDFGFAGQGLDCLVFLLILIVCIWVWWGLVFVFVLGGFCLLYCGDWFNTGLRCFFEFDVWDFLFNCCLHICDYICWVSVGFDLVLFGLFGFNLFWDCCLLDLS